MKKRRLRNWVKVVLTIGALLLTILMYVKIGQFGAKTNENEMYSLLALICYVGVFTVPFVSPFLIWSE